MKFEGELLVLHLIGWECATSFLNQSVSKAIQNECSPIQSHITSSNTSILLFAYTVSINQGCS